MFGTVLGAGTTAVDKTHGVSLASKGAGWQQTEPRPPAGDNGYISTSSDIICEDIFREPGEGPDPGRNLGWRLWPWANPLGKF